jgi:hypothetical protein
METVRLYGAVGLDEFADILRTGKLRSAQGSLEGKWFADRVSRRVYLGR